MIDEAFLVYFISLPGPRAWRPSLENFEQELRKDLREDGIEDAEIERRLDEKPHIFSDGEFKVQTSTKTARKTLKPGVFENLQAKNTIKIVYDSWESRYRKMLEGLIGQEIKSDIWGELGWIRQSISHRDSKGIDKLKKAKLITDFAPGEEIILTPAIMAKIDRELKNWYTKFLMQHFSSRKVEN